MAEGSSKKLKARNMLWLLLENPVAQGFNLFELAGAIGRDRLPQVGCSRLMRLRQHVAMSSDPWWC